MKPLLVKTDNCGNLKITIDDLQKMIDCAYDSGYEDGKKSVPTITSPTWTQPISVPTIDPDYYTTGTPWWETHKYEVTCNEAKT